MDSMSCCNLCPCKKQKVCMILATVDAGRSTLSLCLQIVALVGIIVNKDGTYSGSELIIAIIVCVLMILLAIHSLCLAFRLYFGAKNRDYAKCRSWLIRILINFTITVILFCVSMFTTEFNWSHFSGSVLAMVYPAYEMISVFRFLRKLKLEEDPSEADVTTRLLPDAASSDFGKNGTC